MDPLLDYMDPSRGSLHGFPLQITWLPLLISQISISVLIDPLIDSPHRFHGSPYTFSLQISWISLYICLRFHGSRHTLHGSSHRFHRFPLQMSWISLQICGSPQRLSLIEFMDPHTDVMAGRPAGWPAAGPCGQPPLVDFMDPHIDLMDPIIDSPY